MKVLIWLGCIFVATLLNLMLGYVTGYMIARGLALCITFFIAHKLCKKWDEHKEDQKWLSEIVVQKEESK